MEQIRENHRHILEQIGQYCSKYQRDPATVELIAVGKMHPVERILALAEAGQQHFGENYLQESLEKIQHCNAANTAARHLEWHFIGHIQSRKCREIANHFSWVHTVDSIKVARKLDQHRQGNRLNICIQVNIDSEQTKSGVTPDMLPEFASEVNDLPNLKLRGLMIIPEARQAFDAQRAVFARCRQLMDSLNQQGLQLDQLSMGMTNDMEAAIAEGATMVRIGTALFGARPPKKT